MRVLFFVEGFTDIRFLVGLSEVCELTVAVPRQAYRSSGLDERVRASGARLRVEPIDGGRVVFQARSLGYLWKRAGDFDVVLAQEMLRGALNATLVGALKGVPVVTYMGISPIEYFRCRRERGQIGPLAAWGGELAIRTLMRLNGALAARALVMGPYLEQVAAPFSDRVAQGRYYGVDTSIFRPAGPEERAALRKDLDLPSEKFLVLLSSRISHEKDPETVLRAVAMVRDRGVDAVVLNLGGGHREFLAMAGALGLSSAADWVLARPAVHPMNGLADYYRAADVLAQGSLEEGLGLSPLEALACDTPVVATAIGGLAAHLGPYAALTARRDAAAMAEALTRVAADPAAARAAAASGREYVRRHWTRDAAFRELRAVLADVVQERMAERPGEEHA
jgi:glycosyltransferase involved in cell wall biosynthesis